MKRIGLFGADFEDSKKIVTSGKFSLTAGMPNPIHKSLLNRLFIVFFCGFYFFGILIYAVSIGIPERMGEGGDIHYISIEAGKLISHMSSSLKPVTLTFYLLFLLALIPVFWPKKRLSSQLWTYFPFYFSSATCAFIAGLYLVGAVAYDAYTLVGFWFQIFVGIALFIWIIVNSIRNMKRQLNDEELKPIFEIVVKIIGGLMVFQFFVSLVYHLVNNLPVLWYFYLLGLLLLVWIVVYAYSTALLIDAHIVQAYYIHKYPMEYKEYLGISDREWYSKRYYKKLVKSGQLKERVNPENEEIKE